MKVVRGRCIEDISQTIRHIAVWCGIVVYRMMPKMGLDTYKRIYQHSGVQNTATPISEYSWQ